MAVLQVGIEKSSYDARITEKYYQYTRIIHPFFFNSPCTSFGWLRLLYELIQIITFFFLSDLTYRNYKNSWTTQTRELSTSTSAQY